MEIRVGIKFADPRSSLHTDLNEIFRMFKLLVINGIRLAHKAEMWK